MNKVLLVVFLTLLACQSSESQQILLNIIKSLWSLSGFSITTNWSIADLTTSSITNIVIKLPTGILVKLLSSNTKLALQALKSSSSSISNGPSIISMQVQSRSAKMNNLNALMSEQTINLASNSGTNLAYLLLKIQGACVGQNVPGSPDIAPGVDPDYPGTQNLSNIGFQAQATIQLSITLSGEITNYCQQFADLAKSANVNCSNCPTIEQCLMLSQKWNNTSILISSSSNSTLSNTTLIRSLNITIQNTLIDAISSTNNFILSLRDCAKCINTGCTKNQVQTFRPCDRRKNNGSMSSSDRKEYCRKKANSSARRHSRNISKIRKMKQRKSVKNRRNIGSKNRNHWKNVWTRTREMARNFNSKALTLTLPSSIVKNQMIAFGASFDSFISITGNLTDLISQNATDSINNAIAAGKEQITNATKDYLNVVGNFTEKVASDNIESCLSYAQQAGNLQYELMAAIDNCTSGLDQINQQLYINISVTFTGWVQTINSLSSCHDKCVAKYCPSIPFGSNLGVCWILKRLLPRIFEKQSYVDAYVECQSKCSAQVESLNSNISAIAQIQMESNANAINEAIANVGNCVNSTLIAYYIKLAEIMFAYEQCKSSVVTTTQATTLSETSTELPTGTTELPISTTVSTPPCGTFVRYDPVNAPNDPVTKGFAGGYDLDNSTAYVGNGNVSCNGQAPLPGYILASPPSPKKSGVYISCNNGEQFSDTTGSFLLNHQDLMYVAVNSSTVWSLRSELVYVNTSSYTFVYGRYLYNGRYVLGKVRNLDASTVVMFYNPGTGEAQTRDFEVLICRPGSATTTGSETTTEMSSTSSSIVGPTTTEAPTTTSTTSTTTTTQPCGVFVKYDGVNAPNDPVTKGFAGGVDIYNSTAYVAYGDIACSNQALRPGYALSSPPPPKKSGVYVSCGASEIYTNTSTYYLLNHPDLTFVPTNSTNLRSLPGLVTLNSTQWVYGFGRFFVNGGYALGKARPVDATGTTWTMFYFVPTGELQTSKFEILTCKPKV